MTAIGIDLGTTNSLAACWTEEGPVIIPNVHGNHLTPSVISIDENGEILVGQIAKERLISHPHLTAAVFKRYMGTEKLYKLGGHSFTPVELSSFVLRSLKSDAEAYLGRPVAEAVISVPAYFNDAQRKATKQAAEIAGLKVERLISEPTAAALAYGIDKQDRETKFLVFDLGGGTFDVSVLELFEGIMEVKSIAGDNFLGGEDFTGLLASHFLQSQGLKAESLDAKAYSALYKQAEACKLELGREHTAAMSLHLDGQQHEIRLDRSEFEKIAQPLLLRLRQPVERALRDADLSPQDLDCVILIGGATRMHLVRWAVGKMFGTLPYTTINPDEAVALGAAIQAALKARNGALEELILTDVCPYSLGTGVAKRMANGSRESGYFLPIIERNTPIPVSRVEDLYTIEDNQQHIRIEVYQGESRRVENNIKLGELHLEVPPGEAGEQRIDVRYTYDINGILEVDVLVCSTGERHNAIFEKSPGSMSREEIEARFQALKEIKIHPRDRAENRLLLARGERIYEEALGERRSEISMYIHVFENALASQNDREVKIAADQFRKQLEEWEGWL
ncbi:MAG: molecular chaperone HscC [Paenibacillaceae bacterium]|jgi:molecular chaperone HscC|nr:molecular chaperone HscC [Paenibacillaceae bacterium]